MNLRQLSYFIAIAEQRSIVKAAQVLHVSQPAISTQIKLLEEELEVQLFERRQNGTVLTPEGNEFLGYARAALDTLDAAKASLRAHQSAEVGTVTVGIPGSLSPLFSLPLIEKVREVSPNITVKVVTGLSGHLARWILDGTIDFGLIYSASTCMGLDFELLLKEQMFVAIASDKADSLHNLCVEGEIPFANLRHVPLVMPSRAHGLRLLIDEVAEREGIKLDVRTELDAHELLLEQVLRSSDATLLSLAGLRNRRIPQDQLFTAHIIDPVIERQVGIGYASGRPLTRTARRVESILRDLIHLELQAGWWKFASLNE